MKRLLMVGLVLLFAAFAFGEGNIAFDHKATVPMGDGDPTIALDIATEQDLIGPLYLLVDNVATITPQGDNLFSDMDIEIGVGINEEGPGKLEAYIDIVIADMADIDPVYSLVITWEKSFSW